MGKKTANALLIITTNLSLQLHSVSESRTDWIVDGKTPEAVERI